MVEIILDRQRALTFACSMWYDFKSIINSSYESWIETIIKNTFVFSHDTFAVILSTFSKKRQTVPVIKNHDQCNFDPKKMPLPKFSMFVRKTVFSIVEKKNRDHYLTFTKKGPGTLHFNFKDSAVGSYIANVVRKSIIKTPLPLTPS